MTDNIREVKGSPITQGRSESIAYVFNFARIGTPTSPVITIRNGQDTDTTATNLSGSSSVTSDKVTTPYVTGLYDGEEYRLNVKVTIGGNVFERYLRIIGEK